MITGGTRAPAAAHRHGEGRAVMAVNVSLLGGPSVTEAGTGVVTTRSSRTIALAAFLIVHAGRPQSRQRIAGLFWPDSTDNQALTNLRRELHLLRRALGDVGVLITAKDLRWVDVDGVLVDVRIFDTECRAAFAAERTGDPETALIHADRALEQYRGELLPGLDDDWLLEARADLQRQCAELCALVSAVRGRLGDQPGAVRAARRRIRLEPLEEAGYRALIELQAGWGDRAGAVSTYHRCASVLERELGVSPGLATRRAVQGVLAQREPAGPPLVASVAERAGRARADLIGRSAELTYLRRLWRAAAGGGPALAVVRGSPGVGKTRLAAELAAVAREDGAVVAAGQCFGASGRLALAPVADWLRNPALHPGIAALEPVWRAEVHRLVPADGGALPEPEPARPAWPVAPRPGPPRPSGPLRPEAWQSHRFLEGLARALLGTGRPTLLTLDNLQWCDQETLAFLGFLLGFSGDAPLLVLVTLRAGEPDDQPELADWLVRMRATGRLSDVVLNPLDLAESAQLAEDIAGHPLTGEDRALLQAATGGFPLHIVEAMRTQTGARPAELAVVLSHRLEQLSPAARDVAGLAAAVGRDFALDLLAEASDLDADSVVSAVDELWRGRILQEQGDGYDFSHDLVRDAAYAQVSPPKRWLLHRRLAQGLELLHADELGPITAQLAQQYARGGRPDRAVAYYRRAAAMATAVFAQAEAVRLYEQALALIRAQPPGRERDAQELAVLEGMAAPLNARSGYSAPQLADVLERSLHLAEHLGRTDSALNGLVGLWASRWVQGRVADSHVLALRALARAGRDTARSGAAHFAAGGASLSLGRPAEALEHFDIAVDLSHGALLSIGTRPEVHARAFVAHAHWLLGHDEAARSCAQQAVELARSLDHPYSLALALGYVGVTHQLQGARPAVLTAVEELDELCDRYGFIYYREWGQILAGWARGGDAGLQLAARGIDSLKAHGSFARMPYWLSLLADLQAGTGRRDAARATLDAAVAGGYARSDVWWLPEVERIRAHLGPAGVPSPDLPRLRAAAALAAGHGSVALLARCENDLLEAANARRTPAPNAVRTLRS
jgi:DNA-binding SARP family transcriptional activator/tetratricopeptide (TPR) repeat protein